MNYHRTDILIRLTWLAGMAVLGGFLHLLATDDILWLVLALIPFTPLFFVSVERAYREAVEEDARGW